MFVNGDGTRNSFTCLCVSAVAFFNQWSKEFSALLWNSEMHLFFAALRDGQKPSHYLYDLFSIGNPSRPCTRKEFLHFCHSNYMGSFYKVSFSLYYLNLNCCTVRTYIFLPKNVFLLTFEVSLLAFILYVLPFTVYCLFYYIVCFR